MRNATSAISKQPHPNIVLWDARRLPLPDGCADLVLTDPPYAPRFLPLLPPVVAEAARVLRPGGFLAVMLGTVGLDVLFDAAARAGLQYYALYALHLAGGTGTGIVWRRGNGKSMPIIARVKHVTVFSKGKAVSQTATVNFLNVTNRNPRRWHEWEQDVHPFRYFVEAFSPPGGLVVDPMGGSGTTAVAAAVVGRRWIVGDIDLRAVAVIQQRLMGRTDAGLMTPLPLLSAMGV